jgi:hypothetical protein
VSIAATFFWMMALALIVGTFVFPELGMAFAG